MWFQAWYNIVRNAESDLLKTISDQLFSLWIILAMQSKKIAFDDSVFLFEKRNQSSSVSSTKKVVWLSFKFYHSNPRKYIELFIESLYLIVLYLLLQRVNLWKRRTQNWNYTSVVMKRFFQRFGKVTLFTFAAWRVDFWVNIVIA